MNLIQNFSKHVLVAGLATCLYSCSSDSVEDITPPRVIDVENITIWDGPTVTFSKADGANPDDETNQDQLTDNVWITRGNNGGQIYNAVSESAAAKNSSPADTEWAIGTTEQISNLTFRSFRSTVTNPRTIVGENLVLHLISDDIFLDIRFTSWSANKRGGFSYERSSNPEN